MRVQNQSQNLNALAKCKKERLFMPIRSPTESYGLHPNPSACMWQSTIFNECKSGRWAILFCNQQPVSLPSHSDSRIPIVARGCRSWACFRMPLPVVMAIIPVIVYSKYPDSRIPKFRIYSFRERRGFIRRVNKDREFFFRERRGFIRTS